DPLRDNPEDHHNETAVCKMNLYNKLKLTIFKYGDAFNGRNAEKLIEEIEQNFTKSILLMKEDKPVYVNLHRILYVEKPKETIIHTCDYSYTFRSKEIDLIDVLLNEDNFKIADRKVAVNMDAIKVYDSNLRIIYFDNDIENTKLMVGYAHKFNPYLKETLGKEKDVYD